LALFSTFDRIIRKWRGQIPCDIADNCVAPRFGLHHAHTATATGNTICFKLASSVISVERLTSLSDATLIRFIQHCNFHLKNLESASLETGFGVFIHRALKDYGNCRVTPKSLRNRHSKIRVMAWLRMRQSS
jgi:hypothetical protein